MSTSFRALALKIINNNLLPLGYTQSQLILQKVTGIVSKQVIPTGLPQDR